MLSDELKGLRQAVCEVADAPIFSKAAAADVALTALLKWCSVIEGRLTQLEEISCKKGRQSGK